MFNFPLETQAVYSKTGPGQTLRNALWSSKSTPNEVRMATVIGRFYITDRCFFRSFNSASIGDALNDLVRSDL